MRLTTVLFVVTALAARAESPAESPAAATRTVIKTKGLAAFYDFSLRDASQRFIPHQPRNSRADLALDAVNYVEQYWSEGRPATYADIPTANEGPFGRAVQFRPESEATFRPVLIVPRERLHNSALDVKGPGASVSMVVWLKYASGNHALAGIWHEGTDLKDRGSIAKRIERGKRQYCLFAGLAANTGASAAHVSDNGTSTFGDRYARHLSVTNEMIPVGEWSSIGFVFDNAANTVTSYLNGVATERWVENPAEHPFFKWAAGAYARGEYQPPPEFVRIVDGRLAALKVNPYYFPHDLYNPATVADGGPFTIGRVIHSSRNVGFTGLIGGVAVFNRALKPAEMKKLPR